MTRKGAIRLATIMKVPAALKAADVFVDVFDDLLNTVVNTEQNTTVKDKLGNIAQEAVDYVKEWLRSKKVENGWAVWYPPARIEKLAKLQTV